MRQIIEKQLYHNFSKLLFKKTLLKGLKSAPIRFTKFEELEYMYTNEGRCMSIRSRGKLSSVLVRNKKYGTEQRVFLFNPRLVLSYYRRLLFTSTKK